MRRFAPKTKYSNCTYTSCGREKWRAFMNQGGVSRGTTRDMDYFLLGGKTLAYRSLCSRINQAINQSLHHISSVVMMSCIPSRPRVETPCCTTSRIQPGFLRNLWLRVTSPLSAKSDRLISQTGLAAGRLQQSNSVAFWITRATNLRFDSTVRETTQSKQTARVSAHLPGNHGWS